MQSLPLLSLAIWIPIVFGLGVLCVGSSGQSRPARWLALTGSVLGLLLTLPLVIGYDANVGTEQFVEHAPWLATLNSTYHLGIDGISLWLIVLTAFTTVVIVLASWGSMRVRVAQYLSAFLLLSGFLIGVFASLDGMLFFVFFEATLVPFYLLIGGWGGANRVHAAVKFFFFSLVGSLAMLLALIYLYHLSHSFEMSVWRDLPLSLTQQIVIFLAFFAAFSVKVPMWPVHTWLPDVHVEAPTGGSAVLAAIMLKLGAYGFLRFSMPIAPDASHKWAWLIIALSLIAVIYVGVVALVQKDMKKLVAYSSVAHMGFVTLGFFIFNPLGIAGGIVQMIAHGFVSGAMFLCIGVLYDRVHSREIASYGGVVNTMPKFAAFALLFAMANCGLPATAGFVGEWMVILGAVQYNFWIGLGAATALIFGAAYTLWMYKRVYLGPVTNDNVRGLTDIGNREFLVLGLLAIAVLYMGLYPKPFTDVMDVSVAELLKHVAMSKLQ